MKLTFELCTGEVCLMNLDAAMLRGAQVTLSMNRPGFRKRGWSLPVLFAACMVNQKCFRWCTTTSFSVGNCWQTPCSTRLHTVAALLCCEGHDNILRTGL